MDADREKKVAEIKNKIRQGTYRVDPKTVADAGIIVSVGSRTAARSGR